MAGSIFKAAWWPIHVAVAWALTRDRAFVERSNRAGRSLRGIAVARAMDKVHGKPTEWYFKRATAAWSALREEIAAGKIRASGTPFRRVADLQGHAVQTNEMAREIPAVEIGTLRLQDDGDDKDCLVPEDWRVAHGSNWNNLRGYRNVQVFRDDVLRAFDSEGATPYVPHWERLPEAVKRVVATGANEDQAKQAICTAIADKKIKVRFSIASEESGASFGEHDVGTVRDGDEIEIPSQLAPNDFNWEQSRPLEPWRDIRKGFSALAARWHLEWIEVFTADVSEVLYGAENVTTVRLKKPKRGRPAEYNWDGVKARLLDYVSQHGPMQTSDELMQKCADFASDLHPKKTTPSDKTIREAITTHALDIAAGFAPGKSPGK
jgi:hypothetical protein